MTYLFWFLVSVTGVCCFSFGYTFGRRLPDISLRRKNADLGKQVEVLRSSRLISPEELELIAKVREENKQYRADQNSIVMWMRNNRTDEINRGEHTGLSFSETVIRYLARGIAGEGKK